MSVSPASWTDEKTHFETLRSKASILLKAGRYRDSIDNAKRATAIDPENAAPYALVAYALIKLKDPQAVEWAKKAIAKAPDNPWTWITLGDALSGQRKWTEGLELFEKAAQMNPRDASIQQRLGHNLLHLSKVREAMLHLEKAVQLDPSDTLSYRYLSSAVFSLGDREGAEKYIRKALEIDPDDSIVRSLLGWQLLSRGKRREANDIFRGALRLNPKLKEPKLAIGEWLPSKPKLADRILHASLLAPRVPHPGLFVAILAPTIPILFFLSSIWLPQAKFMIVLIDLVLAFGMIYIALPQWIIGTISRRRVGRFF